MNADTKKRNEYNKNLRKYYKNLRKKKKKRLPPVVLLVPLCAALAVCIALAAYLHRGQSSGAEKYYKNNSKLIDMISLEESNNTLTEMQAMFDLAVRGFAPQFDDDGNRISYPVTYHCAPDGGYVDEAEVSIISTDKHPMYQTFYVSGDTEENRIGWVIDIINGDVFARPVSFLLETTCDKEILLTEDKEGKITSYCDGMFYITVPHETAVTTVTVNKINAETLDGITFDALCALTGATRLASAEVGEGESELAVTFSVSDRKSSALSVSNKNTAIIVSLGDSFSSGEGNPPFYGQEGKALFEKVEEEGWLAHRSTIGWPTRLAVPDKTVELHFVAVAGAVTENIDLTEQIRPFSKVIEDSDRCLSGSPPMPVQLDIFDTLDGKTVDFVTLTIGGNDVKFADIIAQCVMGSSYLEYALYDGTILELKLNKIRANLNDTLNDIERVYKAIETKAPYAAILVAGYPKLLDAKGKAISMQEAELVNNAVSDFNDEIENLVKKCWRSGINIYFVDVEAKFSGHEAYATDENGNDTAWLNPIILPSQPEDLKDGIKSDYSIHPNKFGIQAYAICVNEEIAAYVESGDFGDSLHWEYDIRTDTLTISGTGDMPDFVEFVALGQQSFPWERFMHRIKEVVIEDGVTSIGSFSFSEFDKLERVEIASSVSKIGYRAFFNCNKLSAISNFPGCLSDIGEGAFYGTALTDLYFAGDPPAALEASAGTYAASFAYGAKGDTSKITLHYPAGRKNKWDPDGDGKWKGYRVEPYDIAVSGTVIDFDTYEPVKNAGIRITKQGDGTAYEASTDENGQFTVNIPGLAPVTLTIEISADGYESQTLHQTSGIMVIQLMIPLKPSNSVTVTVVDENGKGLPGITINGTGLDPAPVTGADGSAKFKLSAGTYNLTVADGTVTASKALTVVDESAELEIVLESEFYWDFDERTGTLTIWGSGAMGSWNKSNYTNRPWHNFRQEIKTVEIMDGITSIGSYSFNDCRLLKNIDLPNSLTSIGEQAFNGCVSLGHIDLPDSLVSIGDYAFKKCRLSSIIIPDGVTAIGDHVFADCSNLSNIIIPDRVTAIGAYAFYGCNTLSSIIIPDGVTAIGDHAFAMCINLSSVSIPDGVSQIAMYAFAGCSSLSSIDLPAGLTRISSCTFNGCSSLSSLAIPAGVTNIGDDVFSGCYRLTEIHFLGNVPSITSRAFYYNVTVTAYYPADNATWTADKLKDYGGKITWIPY